ncbi:lipopolysaccharide heptosyltransferase II [Kiritimatiellota bacterium B12222]|nr:lipopolysaccharide heptosyltransferase II [Kiritimatiellota bacterium B12222]
MTGYDASVLNSPDLRLLLIVPNWLGDGIMAMPAVQVLKQQLHPNAQILIAARPGQVGLWEMQTAVHQVIPLPAGTKELFKSAKKLRALKCTHAIVLPHSFRSALLPTLAGIPHRKGTTHQCGRPLLIHHGVNLSEMDAKHQQWEIAKLLLPDPLPEHLPPPQINPPAEALQRATDLLANLPQPILGCIPGAARGPSKQWPGDRFQASAQTWIQATGGSVCWLGTPADEALCESLNAPFGSQGCSLAGKTNLHVFTALLQQLSLALVNDSGGMHLAAAVGTPLIAIFGTTDPQKTGPLSSTATVLQHSDTRNRSIDRHSEEAASALARVSIDEVREQILANLPATP